MAPACPRPPAAEAERRLGLQAPAPWRLPIDWRPAPLRELLQASYDPSQIIVGYLLAEAGDADKWNPQQYQAIVTTCPASRSTSARSWLTSRIGIVIWYRMRSISAISSSV